MKEIWKDITDYEGTYQVSNSGKVRNTKTNKVLSTTDNIVYKRVALYKNNKRSEKLVHRLVAEAFCEKKEG